jgi:hypothetical protein
MIRIIDKNVGFYPVPLKYIRNDFVCDLEGDVEIEKE